MRREPAHSRGAGGADQLILDAVVDGLRARGAEVDELTAEALRTFGPGDHSVILSMARTVENLTRLAAHRRDHRIINDPLATLRTLRNRMYAVLEEHDLPLPSTRLVDVRSDLSPMPFPYWLKRTDYHHILPDDVVQVLDAPALDRARAHFVMQDHERVFQQRHVPGKAVKAYAVYDRRRDELVFFATRSPIDAALTRQLEELTRRIVGSIPLEVLGADFIIGPEGPVVVDVNAWPSFRQCRPAAAAAIVDMVWPTTAVERVQAVSPAEHP